MNNHEDRFVELENGKIPPEVSREGPPTEKEQPSGFKLIDLKDLEIIQSNRKRQWIILAVCLLCVAVASVSLVLTLRAYDRIDTMEDAMSQFTTGLADSISTTFPGAGSAFLPMGNLISGNVNLEVTNSEFKTDW